MEQCEELRIDHLTLLLVVTVPYACWFSWRANYIADFKWRLHFAIWGCVSKSCFERGIFWRALKTSIFEHCLPATALNPILKYRDGKPRPARLLRLLSTCNNRRWRWRWRWLQKVNYVRPTEHDGCKRERERTDFLTSFLMVGENRQLVTNEPVEFEK